MTPNKKPDAWQQMLDSKGYVQIPNCMFRCQGSLAISAGEVVVLCTLLTYGFGRNKIYPSVQTLCDASGTSPSSVRRHVRSLEAKGFVRRIYNTGQSNTYDVMPLLDKLAVHNCNNPIRKRIPTYPKVTKPPPPHMNTKEYYLRRKKNNTGTESIKDIFNRKRII